MSFFGRIQKKTGQVIVVLHNGMQHGDNTASDSRRYLFIITRFQKAADRFVASGGASGDFKRNPIGKIDDFVRKGFRNALQRIIIILKIPGLFITLRHTPRNHGAEQGKNTQYDDAQQEHACVEAFG